MASTITTEDFANYICDKIHEESVLKNYKKDYSFDFSVLEEELPYDFNNETFLNILKKTINFLRVEFHDLDHKLRYFGKIKV